MNTRMYMYAACRVMRQEVEDSLRTRFLEKLTNLTDDEICEISEAPCVKPPSFFADWPMEGESMTQISNLNFLVDACEDVIKRKIEGDAVETGIWRGGCCIIMKMCFDMMESNSSRDVYGCDSFEGCPPDEHQSDMDKTIHSSFVQCNWNDWLKVNESDVQRNSKRYGAEIVTVPGWFYDTMPILKDKVESISILRLDGDCYSSTIDVLDSLYDKVSIGGYIIVDDLAVPCCEMAVNDYRVMRNITTPITVINEEGVGYWIKE